MKQNAFFLLLWLLVSFQLKAQDSIGTLSELQFMRIVQTYHPVAKQARIGVDIQKAERLKARAAFDPMLDATNGNKTFDGKNYYRYQTWAVEIPTWYGIEIQAGQDQYYGDRLSNERTSGNLTYAGVSFSVLQGLLLDKRRAYLKMASILVNQSEFEQDNQINDLLYEALSTYWEWVQAYSEWKVIQEGLSNAEQRFLFTRQQVMIGERAGIDSVEAKVQWQYFQQQSLEANLRLQQMRYMLSAFLWQENNSAYLLPENIQPEKLEANPVQSSNEIEKEDYYVNALIDEHPALQSYRRKIDYWQVNRRLAAQELLPKLDVQYRFLNKKTENLFNNPIPLLDNNYQYGIKFNMPLRLSEGRADVRITKLNQDQTRFELYNKQNNLLNKLRSNYIGVQQLANQWQLQTQIAENQLRLQQGEEIRFQLGESSLFLVNSREQKTIEAKQKQVALQAKYFKQRAALMWSAGLLYMK